MAHTEYTLKVEFDAPSKQAVAAFVQECRRILAELAIQGALLGGETPIVSLTVENNEIGTKQIKVFNGGNNV